MKLELDECDSALQMLLSIQEYLEIRYSDEEEKAKVYPHCMYLLAMVYWQQGEIEKAHEKCQLGITCLVDNGALTLLSELLHLKEVCLEKLGKQVEQEKCRQYIEAIDFVYELAQRERSQELILLLLKESVQRECIISNELIRDMRRAVNMTHEALCDNICAQETLARIETDRTNPNSKNMYDMLKKMGMSREKYYGFIVSDDYALYEKVRLYNRCVGKEEREKAYELLNEIENKLNMKELVNRQFVESGRIRERLWEQKITYEQAIEELKQVLYWTMPQIKGKEMVYRVPFRQEFMILNQMAICYKRNKQIGVALEIYNQIYKVYQMSDVAMFRHAISGFTFYTNYIGYLEVNNEIEKAYNVTREGMQHAISYNRGNMLGGILANLFCIYEKMNQPKSLECYLRQAYILSELYSRENDKKAIRAVYEIKFGKD